MSAAGRAGEPGPAGFAAFRYCRTRPRGAPCARSACPYPLLEYCRESVRSARTRSRTERQHRGGDLAPSRRRRRRHRRPRRPGMAGRAGVQRHLARGDDVYAARPGSVRGRLRDLGGHRHARRRHQGHRGGAARRRADPARRGPSRRGPAGVRGTEGKAPLAGRAHRLRRVRHREHRPARSRARARAGDGLSRARSAARSRTSAATTRSTS